MTQTELIRIEWDGREYSALIHDVRVKVWYVRVVATGEYKYVIAKNVHHFNTEKIQGYYTEAKYLFDKQR